MMPNASIGIQSIMIIIIIIIIPRIIVEIQINMLVVFGVEKRLEITMNLCGATLRQK